ncbi:MAG TPA: porin family protein [Terriglobia bacterium]|nr:porin family protein [Terriglobia bacterium]
MKMKWNTVIVCMLLLGLLVGPAVAQVSVGGGVKGGVNLADLGFDPEIPDFSCCDMRAGGAFGAFVRVGTPVVSFQPEILYSMKGGNGTADDSKIKFNVVEIPLLLRADAMSENRVHPFVTIGPAVSFRTSAKLEAPDGTEEDLKDETNAADVGMIFGGGLAIGPATIEARYDLGLRNLNADPSEDVTVKSRTFSIFFGIGFGR